MTGDTVAGVPILVALGTFDPRDEGGLHALIRRFRAGDEAAFAAALAGALKAIEAAGDLAAHAAVVVPVPDHLAGHHDGPRLALARRLARAHGWQAPEPPPLVRITEVEPAKDRRLRERGDATEGPQDIAREAAGLAWAPSADLRPRAPILLLDDVLASGRTLEACVAAIRRDDRDDRAIRVLVLARAHRAG